MNTEEFLNKYWYKKRIPFINGWKRIDRAPWGGVCQDFALTVLITTEGSMFKALLAMINPWKVCFWFVLSDTNRASKKKLLWLIPMKYIPRHVMLWHRDHGWIDSTYPTWRPTNDPHTRILPLPFPWVWFRTLWGMLNPFK